MINLLPPELKEEYRYARYNRRLLNWLITFAIGIAGVAVIVAGGLLVMRGNSNTYRSEIAAAQAGLASQDIAGTQAQVVDISNNLTLMVRVLSQEILFSKMLARLGTITPSNVILTDLAISQNQSAVDITAETANYNAATQLQVNLADPSNQIFSTADIVSINCATGTGVTNPAYPCTASIRAQFTANNPFLFINAKGKAGAS